MSDPEQFQDPALKNFSPGTYQAKYVVEKTLKTALMGAVIGAAILGLFVIAAPLIGMTAIPGGGFLAALLTAGTASGAVSIPIAGTMVTGALINGALLGGGIGAVAGGLMGANSAPEAAEEKAAQLIAKEQQNTVRQQRMMALERRQQMMAGAGAQPTPGAVPMRLMQPQGVPGPAVG